MALDAVFLQIDKVLMRDPYRFFEILERKSLGMVPAVLCFRDIFDRKLMRDVSIVAAGDLVMARLDPRVVMIRHHVAVHAGLRIIAEIG